MITIFQLLQSDTVFNNRNKDNFSKNPARAVIHLNSGTKFAVDYDPSQKGPLQRRAT